MKAKKLFPDLSFKRLWDKIKELEDKVGEGGGDNQDSNTLTYNEETDSFGTIHPITNEWKDLVFAGFKAVYLYKNGNEFTNDHGGTWTFNSNQSNASYFDFVNLGASNSKTKNADNIYMKVSVPTTAASLGLATCYLSSAIDFTNYSKLVVVANTTGTKYASVAVRDVLPKGINRASAAVASTKLGSGYVETILDISSVVGLNYINFCVEGYAGDNGGSSGSIETKIYEVRLEK